ncbi:MAG: hypothetical protein ACRDWT_13565 [Jatrophihabitantaceae bacterium]
MARSRGAVSGVLLLILGAWAGIVAFIGPYFDFAFTPAPNDAWHWTAARCYLEVLPGGAAFLGGLLLLFSANRLTASLGSWLGILGGAWLVVGPPLANPLHLDLGVPDPSSGSRVQALEELFFFYAIGAAILFVASVALGRLSVHSLRDVRAAERRAAADGAVAEPAVAREPVAPESGPYPPSHAVDPNAGYERPVGARGPVTGTDPSYVPPARGAEPTQAAPMPPAPEDSSQLHHHGQR